MKAISVWQPIVLGLEQQRYQLPAAPKASDWAQGVVFGAYVGAEVRFAPMHWAAFPYMGDLVHCGYLVHVGRN